MNRLHVALTEAITRKNEIDNGTFHLRAQSRLECTAGAAMSIRGRASVYQVISAQIKWWISLEK